MQVHKEEKSNAELLAELRALHQRIAEIEEIIVNEAFSADQLLLKEQALENRNLYETLARNLPDATIFMFDKDLRYIYAEGSDLRKAGFDPETFVGKSLYDMLPQKRADALKPYYQKALNGEDVRFTRKGFDNGRVYSNYATPVRDSKGEIFAGLIVTQDITEQTAASERVKRIYDTSLDLLGVATFDGYFKNLNPAWEDVLGYTIEELEAQPFVTFMHPDDLAKLMAEVEASASDVEEVTTISAYENRYRHKNGSYRWLSWNVVTYPEEEVVYFSARDITEQKSSRLQLQANEARLASILDIALDAIIVINDRYEIEIFNRGAEAVFGYQADEIKGKNLALLLPERFHANHEHYIQQFAQGDIDSRRMSERSTIYGKRKDGSEFPAEASISKLEHHGQQFFTVTLHDITKRKQTEAAIKASEKRFKAIFNQTYQFIGLLEPDGNMIEANQTALDFAGVESSEMVKGLPFWDAPWWQISEDTQHELKDAIKRAATGEFVRYEVDVQGVGGVVITIDFSLKPVFGDDGEVIMLIPEGRNISEQKELQGEKERLAAIIEATSDFVATIDLDGNITYLNSIWRHVRGIVDDEDLPTTHLRDYLTPDTYETIREKAFELAAKGGSWTGDGEILSITGNPIPVSQVVIAHYDEKGKPESYSIIFRDMTMQQQTIAALTESEGKFRHLFDTANVSLWIEDFSEVKAYIDNLKAQGVENFRAYFGEHPEAVEEAIPLARVLDVNPYTLELYGAPTKELLFGSLARVFTEDSTRVFTEELIAIAEGQMSVEAETTVRRITGEELDVLFIIAFGEHDPDLRQVVVSMVDISERKQAEAEIQEYADHMQLLQDIAVIANSAVGVDAVIQFSIEQICKTLDWSVGHAFFINPVGDLVTMDSWYFDDPERFQYFADSTPHKMIQASSLIQQVYETRIPMWVEDISTYSVYVRQAPAEKVGLVTTVAFPILIGDEVVAILEVFAAERRVPDADMLDMFVHIGSVLGRVIERDNADAALLAQNQKLEASNTELERFAYVASHDLQEPLRMVTSYMGLLERRYKDTLDESGLEFLNFAVDGAKRMQQLIEDLLQFSRLNTQKKPHKPTDLNKIVGLAQANLKIAIEDSQAKIDVDALPTVMADDVRMVQLFQNLIGNAIKFRREDVTPHIRISAKKEGDKWLIAVEDNGIGLDSQYAERIFVLFQRLHTKEEYAGTGIGLAMCRRIVELHGGQITVESKLGQGAIFRFTLPVIEE